MQTESVLDSVQLKTLKTLTSNATLQLSSVFSKWVSGGMAVELKPAEIVSYRSVIEEASQLSEIGVGALLGIEKGIQGSILFVFTEETCFHLCDLLLGQPVGKTVEMTPLATSAMQETANILACGFLNSLGNGLGAGDVIPGPPIFFHDMTVSVVESALAELAPWQKQALLVHIEFQHTSAKLKGTMFFFPLFESLVKALPVHG